jgi:hypothetical protein
LSFWENIDTSAIFIFVSTKDLKTDLAFDSGDVKADFAFTNSLHLIFFTNTLKVRWPLATAGEVLHK